MGRTRRQVLAASAPLVTLFHGGGNPAARRPCRSPVDGTTDARIGFTGDVMFGRYVNEQWRDRDPAGVWGSTLDSLDSLDGLVVNLECSLSTRGSPREGRTYHFRADPAWTVLALEEAGVTVASLANNHQLDFGSGALADTREALSGADIAHPGAGPNAETAREPSVVEIGGLTVGVVSFTDQAAAYAAGPDSPGTAYLTLDHRRDATRNAVRSALADVYEADPDLVVASLHWGPNWEVEPSTTQRAFARWLVDEGVDVVHGHSAHVIQGVEVYRGRPICYDCGDFVDDYVVKDDLHNDRSFLFELRVEGGELAAVDLWPVEIVEYAVQPAGDEAAAWLRDRMRSLSEPFGTAVEERGRGLSIPLENC